jgi:response regulator RpfG family c-di-GMP phosphodiesterase
MPTWLMSGSGEQQGAGLDSRAMFAALTFPDTDGNRALLVAGRLHRALAREFGEDTVRLTVSFGVGGLPEHGQTAGSLPRVADEALYETNDGGREISVLPSDGIRDAPRVEHQADDPAGEHFLALALGLAEAVDLRFSGSTRHSETVGRYAAMMAAQLGLPEQRIERVRLAGMLHDVGKAVIPDAILNKPASLTEEEYQVVKRHPEFGAQILEHPSLGDLREWIGAHHERPDGNGYPRGLSDEQLPLEARILAVADAYEAMTSDRAYRGSLGPLAASSELERCGGAQFDVRVVRALLASSGSECSRGTRFDVQVVQALLAMLEREAERVEAVALPRASDPPATAR